jgi:hypothetical protein
MEFPSCVKLAAGVSDDDAARSKLTLEIGEVDSSRHRLAFA